MLLRMGLMDTATGKSLSKEAEVVRNHVNEAFQTDHVSEISICE